MKTTLRMGADEINSVLMQHMLRTRPIPQGTFSFKLEVHANGADSYAELTVEVPEGSTFEHCNTVEINNLVIEK